MPTLHQRARGRVAYEAGKAAEASVAAHYSAQGNRVLHTRWRGTSGEIDLIVEQSDGYVFVEVKKARSFAEAAQRLGARQVSRLCHAGLEFVAQSPLGMAASMRFDVAVVDALGECRIIENAFGEGGAY